MPNWAPHRNRVEEVMLVETLLDEATVVEVMQVEPLMGEAMPAGLVAHM